MSAIRALGPLDAFKYSVLGQSKKDNHAYTLEALANNYAPRHPDLFSIRAICARRSSTTWVCRNNGKISGLASASERSGPSSWEFTHLCLGSGGEAHVTELLDVTTAAAASKGAQTVFVRLRLNDPFIGDLRRSGFFPYVAESLFIRRSRPGDAVLGQADNGAAIARRRRRQRDDYGLFRLHNSVVPLKARRASGMTFEQWSSSRERVLGSYKEDVVEDGGTVLGWLSTAERYKIGRLDVMLHPDADPRLISLVDVGLKRLSNTNIICCLVPEYQDILKRVLPLRGFTYAAEFVTLARPTTVHVEDEPQAAVMVA